MPLLSVPETAIAWEQMKPPAILSIFLGRHLSHMLDEVVARLNDAELTLMKRKHCNWVSGAYLPYCKTIQTVTVPLLLPSPETVLNSVLQAHLPTVRINDCDQCRYGTPVE